MNSLRKRAMSAPVAVIVLVLTLGLLPTAGQAEIELVAVIPPAGGITPEFVDGIEVMDNDPNKVVFVTRNLGAMCEEGGGTPASAWKMTVDPVTGQALTLVWKQHLSQIQLTRDAFLESTGGMLFTGGGWCNFKPPYVSMDGGETYRAATVGVHPPNSTFSLVEFQGNVYAGTGYQPWPAEVYRWIGDGTNDWELVFHPGSHTNYVRTMAVHQGQLFVGTSFISCGGCASMTAVYVSPDGNTFNPTMGIPSCHSVFDLLAVGDELIARTGVCGSATDYFIYQWDGSSSTWAQTGLIDFGLYPRLVEHDGVIYAYGQAPSDADAGIYRSEDLGQSWEQIEVFAQPEVTTLHMHEGTLYLGTKRDDANSASIYRLVLEEVRLDIKPGSCPNSFNRKSHGVLPVAIVGSDGFDVTLVDTSTVQLSRADGVGGSVGPNEGPPGPHSTIDDVATGFAASMECECDALGGDGITDLSMKFKTDDVVAALELNALPAGDLVPLVVTGTLLDGTPFQTATDCIRLVPPGTPPGMLTVGSNISEAWVAMSPLDLALDGGGFAAFDRVFPLGTVVSLTAEATMNGRPLIAWRIDGVTIEATSLTRQIVIAGDTMTVSAIYRSLTPGTGSHVPMLMRAGISGPPEPQ